MTSRSISFGSRSKLVAAVALTLASVAALTAADAAPVATVVLASSTFDEGADGWTVVGEAQGPNFQATGGHPGGYVAAVDPPSTTGTSYWSAPAKFLGNQSAAYKQTLSYEVRDTGPGTIFREADVALTSGSLTLEYRQKKRASAKRWTRIKVAFKASEAWTDASTGRRATAAQMQTVLAALDSLYVRGEFRNGAETFDLDNVILRGRQLLKR